MEWLTCSVAVDIGIDLCPGAQEGVRGVGVAVDVGDPANGVNDLLLTAVRIQVELDVGAVTETQHTTLGQPSHLMGDLKKTIMKSICPDYTSVLALLSTHLKIDFGHMVTGNYVYVHSYITLEQNAIKV